MLALNYLYHMLATFRPLFSRHTPWVLFCIVILGFIGTPHLEGLTSLDNIRNRKPVIDIKSAA
jgi:hypothetical protein